MPPQQTRPTRTSLIELSLVPFTRKQPGDRDKDMPSGIDDLVEIFSPAALTYLEIIGECAAVEVETWTTLFCTFPSSLSFRGAAHAALFSGLRGAWVASVSGVLIRCPRLERVWVDGYWETSGAMKAAVDPLLDCLQFRAERGTRLKELHMEICCPDAEGAFVSQCLPLLREFVSNVMFEPTLF